MYPWLKYNLGIPQPSVPAKELVGIKTLCDRAARTGNGTPLRRRLAALQERDADSFALLAFQAALVMGHKHPVAAARNNQIIAHLDGASPAAIGKLATRVLKGLAPKARTGRGGARNKGPIAQYALVREIGFLFEAITDRKPGITYSDEEGKYTGPFVEFAMIVHQSLGLKVNGRQIQRRFSALDVPEWERSENRVAWRRPSTSATPSSSK
jgi:hypothetical protein